MVQAQAVGDDDEAILFDSPGDDVLNATPSTVELLAADGGVARAVSFPRVIVHAEDGNDTANFFGGGGDDYYFADATTASIGDAESLGESSYWREVRNFDIVIGHDSPGVNRAVWQDTSAADLFRGFATSARLLGGGMDVRANGYDVVSVYSDQGGSDRAELFGSAAVDALIGGPGFAVLTQDGPVASYRLEAHRFEVVDVQSSGPGDYAVLSGSQSNDRLIASPSIAQLNNDSDLNITARGFANVTVHGDQGGTDRAELRGSTGNDLYSAGSAYAYLRNRDASAPDYYVLTRDFEVVEALGRGGDDLALLYDSAGDDLFHGRAGLGILSGEDFFNSASGFAEIRAFGVNGGQNLRDISALDYLFRQVGSWRGRF